jgi:competence protein ComEC
MVPRPACLGIDPDVWARAAALAPVVLAAVGPWAAIPVWGAVFAGGLVAGGSEAAGRRERVTASAAQPWSPAIPLEWTGTAILRVTGWAASRGDGSWQVPGRLLHPNACPLTEGMETIRAGQGVLVRGRGPEPAFGSLITAVIMLKPPGPAGVPGGFDYGRFLAGRGILWTGRLDEWHPVPSHDPAATLGRSFLVPVRGRLVAGLEKLLPARAAAIARGVLLGQKDPEGRLASRPFADLGLAHLFAVSGLHVGILLGIFVVPGKILGLAPWPRALPLVVLLPVYVLLTGMPGSVVRAAGLGAGALLAAPLGRRNSPLSLVGILFWVGVVWDPSQVLDIGVRLSYFAAGGILAVSRLTGGFRFTNGRLAGMAAAGLAVSVSAQWFTLPLVADSFGRISLVSPLANLAAVPLFGLAIWAVVLALALDMIIPWAAESLAAWAWLLMRSLSAAVALATKPGAGWPLGLPPPGPAQVLSWGVLTAGLLVLLWQHRTGKLRGRIALPGIITGVLAGLYLLGPAAWTLHRPDRVTVWQFDVGQGDCGLLVFPDGWSALIDAGGVYGRSGDGPMARHVLPFVRRQGLSGIDAGLLTHGHLDHTGGAEILVDAGLVGTWYCAGRADKALRGHPDSNAVRRPAPGELLHRWRDWDLSVVYPPVGLPDHLHENDHSLVAVLRRAGRPMMVWSGDLEEDGEDLLLGSGRAPAGTRVWKAGHHGSNTSGSRAFVERLAPQLIVVSCGLANGYGHPSHGPYLVGADTLQLTRTDLEGSILIRWDEDGRTAWSSRTKSGQIPAPP